MKTRSGHKYLAEEPTSTEQTKRRINDGIKTKPKALSKLPQKTETVSTEDNKRKRSEEIESKLKPTPKSPKKLNTKQKAVVLDVKPEEEVKTQSVAKRGRKSRKLEPKRGNNCIKIVLFLTFV